MQGISLIELLFQIRNDYSEYLGALYNRSPLGLVLLEKLCMK